METLTQNQGYLYTFSKQSFEKDEVKPDEPNCPSSKNEIILTLIADDHPYLIHGVETDLNKDKKIKIVGTAGSYDEVISRAAELQPDIVLLDLRMPGRDKHDLKHYITGLKAVGKCKVIIFSNETGWARIHRCLDIGASAYIEKAISIGRLAEFIRRVHENHELLIFTAEELPQIQFSKRQKEILHFIADGKENDEIANVLNIEIKTVQSYVNEIKAKFSEAFSMHPIRPRTLLLLASKLGFGNKVV
ncbi:MAG: response regulator transcription factor [Candidatus Melainabacteria bacterium]|nr:response regulator transcription factor [Candidatus Melainabacteria bacterium]